MAGYGVYVYKTTNVENPITTDNNITRQVDISNSSEPKVQNSNNPDTSPIEQTTQTNKSTLTSIPDSGMTTQIKIDFSTCKAGRETVYFGFGSTVFIFTGITNGKCNFQYGTEIEDPRWDGSMSHTCAVPATFGEKTYEVQTNGIVMNGLQSYCSTL
ncbi:MAG: hypothetical protein WCT44_03415 [Candidatus Paceibacterota bacterium]